MNAHSWDKPESKLLTNSTTNVPVFFDADADLSTEAVKLYKISLLIKGLKIENICRVQNLPTAETALEARANAVPAVVPIQSQKFITSGSSRITAKTEKNKLNFLK